MFGYVNENPYDILRFKRSESSERRFLSRDELDRFKSVKLTEPPLIKARDCFLFQCYTGLAYVDMCNFDFESMAKEVDGAYRVKNERVKTGNKYNIRRVNQQVQNYKTYLKNSHFGVEKFNFSLGLSFNFFCMDIILLSV